MDLVSIVIPVCPAHNRPDFLGACLESISSQTYPKDSTEVIVVGDSCDVSDAVRCFCDPKIRTTVLCLEKRVGPICARNQALKVARGKWVAFLDADAVADGDWLRCLTRGFGSDAVGGCGGDIVDEGNQYDNRGAILGSCTVLPFTGFGNAIFRKDILDQSGLLDEALDPGGHGSEDVDLSWRTLLQGYRIEYIPGAKVRHRGSSHARHGFAYGVGMRRLMEKYREIIRYSSWVQLRRYAENIKHSYHERCLLQELPRHLMVLAGYLWGMMRHSLRLGPPVHPLDLQNVLESLRPAQLLLKAAPQSSGDLRLKEVLWWKSENGFTLFQLAENKVYEFQGVAARMWELMIWQNSPEDISDALLEEYEIGKKEAENDFLKFIEHLCKEKILKFVRNG